jgi:hypothetical protein
MKSAIESKSAACGQSLELIRPYLEGELSAAESANLQQHIKSCASCKTEFEVQARLISLLNQTFESNRVSETFDLHVNGRLKAQADEPELSAPAKKKSARRSAVMAAPRVESDEEEAEPVVAAGPGWMESLSARLGGAPWWGVSLALHVLIIVLASLVSKAIELPHSDDGVIMVTELQSRAQADAQKEEKHETDVRDALNSKETQPTDPTSQEASNITVPPDILAKAELGDHFETINPDLPDTHSAYGNPDSQSFHSVSGSADAVGGGGTGGIGMEDVIGVGGAASKGSGGGFGGGDGTGIGTGSGAGKGSFGSRNGGGRKLMVKRHGGSKETESAVDKALHWLAYHQEPDGHWDGKKYGGVMAGDPALTGLATLAFLGAGHTEKIGGYKDNVKRAIGWIITQQDGDGCISKNDRAANGYNHPMASLALAEAAGMARIPETCAAAQKAVDYSVNVFQCGKGSDRLGWRYNPQEMGDVSTTGWFVMQLKSAKVAGLHVDPLAFEGASRFLDTLEVEKKDPKDPYSGNHFGYRADAGGQGVAAIRVKNPHCNTAIGCLIRLFLGMKADEVQGAAEWFMDKGGVPTAQKPEYYHWYYATLTTFQVGGDVWKKWNEAIKTSLLSLQCKGGDNDGSFDPKGHSTEGAEQCGGRVFTTAIGALCLEVYYRYAQLQPGR